MGLTLASSSLGPEFFGRRKRVYKDVTFDSSYALGGESITAAQLAARTIEGAEVVRGNAASIGYDCRFIKSTGKFLAFRSNRVTSYTPGGGDIKGATNPAGTEGNADQAAAPVNDALLLARTTFTSLAGTMTPTTQPDVPRNIVITVTNDSGAPLDLFEGTTTFLITGTDVNGAALTESVTLVSTSGNKSVATAKFRYVQGVKAFKTVTSVAITNAPAATLKGSLGVGTRIGLPTPLETPALADVLEITLNAARLAPTGTVANAGGVDTTNNTINTGTTADGNDLSVTYRDNGQVAEGTDLSGVVVHVAFECT